MTWHAYWLALTLAVLALTRAVRVWPSTATNLGPTATESYWCPGRTGPGRCCVVLAPPDCDAAEDGR